MSRVKVILSSLLWSLVVLMATSCTRTYNDSLIKKGSSDLQNSPRIITGELENGLRYYALKNLKPDARCYLRLHVAIGSFVEAPDELGVAHLLEHLAFDDQSVSAGQNLAEWFQEHGMSFGPDANAETFPEYTVYKIDLPTCDKGEIDSALRIFRGFADGLKFREETVTKEKKIVDAEELEYSNAENQLTKRFIENLYSGTFYVSRPVLGETKIRTTITPEIINNFYKKWYTADKFSVVVAGDFGDLNPGELIKNVFATMAKRPPEKKPTSPDPNYEHPFFGIREDNLAYVETIFTIQAKQLAKPAFTKSVLRERISFDLALMMLRENFAASSRGNLRVTSIDGSVINNGLYELTLNVASLDEDLEDKFLQAYLSLRRAAEEGFEEHAFTSAKSIYEDMLAQGIVSETTATSDQWTERIINHINEREIAIGAQEYMAVVLPILQDLTMKDSMQVLKKVLRSGHHYLYALGSIEEGEKTNKRLEKLLRRANAAKLSSFNELANVDFQYQVKQCTLFEDNITELSNVGGKKLSLANGTELIFKSTDFKKDELAIKIFTDTGYATMSKRDLDIARMAKIVLLEGGLLQHDNVELTNIIKDKFFTLSMDMFDDRLQANLFTRNHDARFAFELARAFIIEPQYSEEALNRVKEQFKVYYAQREHNLQTPLDEFTKVLANDDYRVGISSLQDMLSITRDDLLSWHKKYIFEKQLRITIVGDFTDDTITDVKCVFSTLPPRKKTQSTPMPKIAFKNGVNVTHKVAAKDKGSLILLRYPLGFTGPNYPDHRWQIIQDLLVEHLRIKLREKRQATYSPTVVVTENKSPLIQNWIDILLLVEKDQASKILNDVRFLVEKLKNNGITLKQLKKAKEPYAAQMKKALMDNAYWASMLANNFDNVSDIKWISNVDSIIKAINIQEINQLLKRYFHVKNSSSVISNPTDQ